MKRLLLPILIIVTGFEFTSSLQDSFSTLMSGEITPAKENARNFTLTDSISDVPDLILKGGQGYFYYGWAGTESSGDLNNDGFDDIIVRSTNLVNDRILVYFGSLNPDSISDLTISLESSGANYFRGSVSIVKDINGDSYDDLVIGSPAFNNNNGRTYIHFGGQNINNIADVVIEKPAGSGAFGNSVSSAGDVNNDGFGDIIVGAYGLGTGATDGKAYIFLGSSVFNIVPDVIFSGESTGNYFGQEVSEAGDVNNDGFDDVVIGAPKVGSGGGAYIYFGGAIINNIADVVYYGESGEVGNSVSTAGDVNNDNFDDVIIGDLVYSGNLGRAMILLGGNNMNSVPDKILYGTYSEGLFGHDVSNSGDINVDGFSDVIVGSPRASIFQVFYGGADMDVQPDYHFGSSGSVGHLVGSIGDFNNDGVSDIIAGAPDLDSGRSFVFFGRSFQGLQLINPVNYSTGLDLDVIFHWNKLNVASTYKLIIATDPALNNIVFIDSTIVDTTKSLYLSNYSTKYFWRVQTRDSNGYLKSSPIWNFETRPRTLTQLSYPTNGSSGIGLSDVFSWEQLPNTSNYRVLISLDSTFQNVVFVDSVFNDTSIAVSGFSYLTKYFWKVGAKDTSGLFYYSDVWNFTTIPRPLVQLIRPIDDSLNASTNMNFVWESVPYATSYRLQIAIDSTFNNVQYNFAGLSDTSEFVAGLSHSKRYFWRVGARDVSGPTYYSTYRVFTTMPQLRLNVTILMEGMYFPLFNQLSRKDSVRVILRQSNAPYSVVDSVTAAIDSLNYTGLFVFPRASAGRYYIVVKHFNCVETWSRAGGEELIGGITNAYNFTTSASQAYGSNLKLRGSKYCMYSGDINQSGFIDGSDAIRVHSDSQIFLNGRYLVSDLNGDNIVDVTDYVIVDNNAYNFVGTVRP